eukprot:CAMPEP_0174301090 /NCGR_PEP_ID=MMETSP0809-20121228/58842_1 /TAXON_ID=73025 ORGANISM="Eutreptiella gymnastica-like, Strain CCMP1594" /NCGR_SAMPLE_ID=MMETSP0809 /ASSEMBLY_ACC=CAM_ASM_000658 /LENGTH=100 /DNA_ID=CAMNT_0015406775 /DNA_START=1285 /DNA_END=1587 /DNA_ORIENTATION=+
MSLCLLEVWVPQHKVKGTLAWCMSATVMNKSMMPPGSCHPLHTITLSWGTLTAALKPAPKPAAKGKHVQLFKVRWKVGKGFYSVPVNQNASNWVVPELCT